MSTPPQPEASTCPRCGVPAEGVAECSRCGVVIAKATARTQALRVKATAPPPAASAAAEPTGMQFGARDAFLGIAVVVAGGWLVLGPERPPAPAAKSWEADTSPAPRSAGPPAPGPPRPAEVPLPLPAEPPGPARPPVNPKLVAQDSLAALSSQDRQTWDALKNVAERRAPVESETLYRAEDLQRRYPSSVMVKEVVRGVFEVAVAGEKSAGRVDEALRYLERMADLWPQWAESAWTEIVDAHFARERWSEAEAAAHRGLTAKPESVELSARLARALIRQDRNQEAAEVLRRALIRNDHPQLRQMLAGLERGLGHERHLAQERSLHFIVHYEGQVSGRVGAELLQFLERQHDELARTFGSPPRSDIPVVLYPSQAGLQDSGAPRWAAATYSHDDGRIRVGTADLQYGISASLQETLAHELVHAFVRARSNGHCPRAVNEGLAQYLSGERPRPVPIDRAALEEGCRVRVRDFYEAALSFVDHVIRRHGQASMNAWLEGMGRTDVDAAARRAYGLTYRELRQEWAKALP